MAIPIGDERQRGQKAISRPQGGWFARIWNERSADGHGAPSSGEPERIRLGRSEAFTLWTRRLTGGVASQERRDGVGATAAVAAIPGIPSRAFTIWTRGGACASPQVSPLPEAVFADVARPAESRAFTLWTTGEALGRAVEKAAPQEDADELMPTWQEGVERGPQPAIFPLVGLAAALVLLLIAMFFAAEKSREAGVLRGQIGAIKKDRKGLRAENAGLATALQGEQTKVAESGRQLQATQAVGEALTSQRDALRVKIAQEATQHETEIGSLGEKLETSQRELAMIEGMRAAEGKEREQLAAAKVMAEKRGEDLQAAMGVEKKRHAEATKTAAAKLDATTEKLAAAEAEAARLVARLVGSEKVTGVLQKEIDFLNEKIAKMKKDEGTPPDETPVPKPPETSPELDEKPDESPDDGATRV